MKNRFRDVCSLTQTLAVTITLKSTFTPVPVIPSLLDNIMLSRTLHGNYCDFLSHRFPKLKLALKFLSHASFRLFFLSSLLFDPKKYACREGRATSNPTWWNRLLFPSQDFRFLGCDFGADNDTLIPGNEKILVQG